MEELDRAEQWLRLAVGQPEPPVAALETLGILLANRGDTVQARNLWLTGVRVDGHPDFFAHLARLAFSEEQEDEAWDKVVRGLRRISERSLHPGEWDEDAERGGVLLRYLSEHLEEQSVKPPADVVELLVDLSAQIREPEDRLDLGLCLRLVGRPEEAKRALRAALPHVESNDRRDVGAEALVRLLFPDFEERFPQLADIEADGEAAREGLCYLEALHAEVPQFWPALYFLGCLREGCGQDDAAYAAFRRAARLRRDQAQILSRLAQSARRLGKRDEAVAAVRSALELDPHNPALAADGALVFKWAGLDDEAKQALDDAEKLHPENPDIDAARRVIEKKDVEKDGGGQDAPAAS
jgi:tetratricopeptide (TPR) repeat protein